ncbi:MAG: lysine 5,6-aminomutase subunit alpha, partial [Prevotellaceae bacterium]|nr:lysine 5,6-aminomutase subunit alpha [Prevotellaceae bacterium]
MIKSKLGLDFQKVAHAKQCAKNIADDVQNFVEGYTTATVERTICRLLGIDGVDENGVPLPNILVDELKYNGILGEGIMFFLGNAMVNTCLLPQQIAEKVAANELEICKLPFYPKTEIEKTLQPSINQAIKHINNNRQRRENFIKTIGEGAKPYLYVIVATGNIYEDVVQAQAAA